MPVPPGDITDSLRGSGIGGEFPAVVTLGDLGRPAAVLVSRLKFENSVFVHFYLLMVCSDTEPSRERPAEQTIK